MKSTQNQFYNHTSIYKRVIDVLMYFLFSNIDVDGHETSEKITLFTVDYQIPAVKSEETVFNLCLNSQIVSSAS